MGNVFQDVRYALRGLRKSPAYTLVAVVTLMLAIGANLVAFGVLNALVLRPLPVSDPAELVQIRTGPRTSGGMLTTSYPAFQDFQRRNSTFRDIAAIYGYSGGVLRWGHAATNARGYEVSGNYFELLGVSAALGRFFRAADEQGPGSAPYLVLSDALWRRAFAADPGVIGTTVQLHQHSFTVLGVAAARFHGTERLERPDYWIPLVNGLHAEGSGNLLRRTGNAVTMIGRLKPGTTLTRATEDLNGIAADLAREFPETDRGIAVRLIHPGLFGDDGAVIHGFLLSVTALALLLLAAACANLASLAAARAADRGQELAVRVALGAGRLRLLRPLLTEAVLVALFGGTAGLAGAGVLLGVLHRWYPSFGYGGQQLAVSVDVDARGYVAALVLTVGSALVFGLVAARQAWRSTPSAAMKGAPAKATHRRGCRLRNGLLGIQIAICTLLISASWVAVRGAMRALHAPLGFVPQGAMLAAVDLPQDGIGAAAALEQHQSILAAVRNLPGVTAVGAARTTPMGGGKRALPIYREGTTEFTPDQVVLATRAYPISPDYLEAAGTRLVSGRDVSWHDSADTPDVALVNETFARRMWGEMPAVGERFMFSRRLVTVVGVVEDGKYHDLMEAAQPAVFLPLAQHPASEVILVIRSELTPPEISAALHRTLGGIAPNVPITLQSWPAALAHVLFPARAATVALGVMGVLAAMLAVTGIFGVAAYNVSRRRKELGIRVALGARTGHVLRAAVGRPIVVLSVGATMGLLVGMLASRLLAHVVYQADTRHPVVLLGAVVTMVFIGLSGSVIPARRALAVDASRLLREE